MEEGVRIQQDSIGLQFKRRKAIGLLSGGDTIGRCL